ncbi:hypothetical protein D623_10004703 [Myotis brandtii]|uniref:Uncharacterized protein n=1 Tax=Myotis brandtii TaxID=109478 RepID=S7N1R4_MYOBR|nr:hypothetical protein D623_10004703 [Myotis brandtii]
MVSVSLELAVKKVPALEGVRASLGCAQKPPIGLVALLSAATYGGPGMTWEPVTPLGGSNLLLRLQQTQV